MMAAADFVCRCESGLGSVVDCEKNDHKGHGDNREQVRRRVDEFELREHNTQKQ